MKFSKIVSQFLMLAGLGCLLTGPGFAQDQPPVPPKLLTLTECLSEGLKQHPWLAAAASRVAGAEEMRRYAGQRPNPVLTIQTENWRVAGAPTFAPGRDLDLFVFGTQTIETAGKAVRRTDLAGRAVTVAQDEAHAVRWQLQHEIMRQYFRTLQAQTTLESVRENRVLLVSLVEYAAQRVSAGFAPESELVRARLEQQTQENHEAGAALDWERARLDLLRAMGATQFESSFRLASADNLPPALPLAELERVAFAERPDLLTLRAKLEQAQAALRLAQADLRPDIDVSLGYKRTGNFNTVIAYVAIPLAVNKRKQGTVGQLAAEVSALEQETKALENFIRADLANSLHAANRLAEQMRLMHQEYLRNADDARDIALIAYREGVHDLYKVLDAQRARNEARLLQAKTRIELQAALSALTLATGQDLTGKDVK